MTIEDLKQKAISIIATNSTKKRKQYETNLEFYLFFDKDGNTISDINAIEKEDLIYFSQRSTIPMRCGSDWSEEDLQLLRIAIENVDINALLNPLGLTGDLPEQSTRASELITRLGLLNNDTLARYNEYGIPSTRNDELLQEPIVKSILLLKKYSNHESAVDSFVQHLLVELGFETGMMYVFNKLRLQIRYGTGEFKDATADFTVLDGNVIFENVSI